MAEHTKGPWTANVCAGFIDVRAQKEDPPVVGWQGFDECFRSKVEHIANARLIAAAPNLLAAAEAAKALLDYMHLANAKNADEEAEIELAGTLCDLGYKIGEDTYADFVDRLLTAAIAEARGTNRKDSTP